MSSHWYFKGPSGISDKDAMPTQSAIPANGAAGPAAQFQPYKTATAEDQERVRSGDAQRAG